MLKNNTTKMSKVARKVFEYNSKESVDNMTTTETVMELPKTTFKQAVSAAGCLFYKVVNDEKYVLLISYADPNWPKLDDFGGQVDSSDNSVYDTMKREVSEETNGLIDLDEHKISKVFYTPKSKYCLGLIEVDKDSFEDTTIFGTVETTDNIKRTIKWYKFQDVTTKMAFRLTFNTELTSFLQ